MVDLKSVRGMKDIISPDINKWQEIEKTLRSTAENWCFNEIRTPILEETALFERGIGETSDIVEKEMFIIKEGDKSYALRPENTASVARALLEKGGLSNDFLEKFFYIGPMFRKERPQRGRLRQFNQFGLEIIGSQNILADTEVIAFNNHILNIFGIKNISLKINSLGNTQDRIAYRQILANALKDRSSTLCDDCNKRAIKNPLRIFDCKNVTCQEVKNILPKITDHLSDESKNYFESLKTKLTNIKIDFNVDHKLVRGLDYYCHTVFEFVADDGLGAQNTILAGGRYDGLFQILGHKNVIPAVGSSLGIERLLILLEEQNITMTFSKNPDLGIIIADESATDFAYNLAINIRAKQKIVDISLDPKSVKSQMRRAGKLGCKKVIIIGQNELNEKKVILKSMTDDINEEMPLDDEKIALKI